MTPLEGFLCGHACGSLVLSFATFSLKEVNRASIVCPVETVEFFCITVRIILFFFFLSRILDNLVRNKISFGVDIYMHIYTLRYIYIHMHIHMPVPSAWR